MREEERRRGSIGRGVVRALCGALWLASLGAGCGIGVPGSSSSISTAGGDNPRCSAYCNARVSKGCGGDTSLCLLACNVIYSSAKEGICQQDFVNLQDCEYDPAILDLGCAPPQSMIDAYCKAQQDAYRDCAKRRDGT